MEEHLIFHFVIIPDHTISHKSTPLTLKLADDQIECNIVSEN